MKLMTLLLLLTALTLPVATLAQTGAANAGAAGRQQPTEDLTTRDTLSQSDLKRLSEQIDQWNRVDGRKGVPPRLARQRAAAMLGVLDVSCAVSDAVYRGQAPDGGGPHIYEAACEEGLGYLLMLQGTALTGTSCLAEREDTTMNCTLPANLDGKVMVGTLLNRQHIPCKVQDFKWLGASLSDMDHVEVACEGGSDYVIRSPRPGTKGKFDLVNCQDAIKQGITCQLTPASVVASSPAADTRPTLAWFKEALGRNGVSCESKRARIIGRESIKRRYLVEFECADHPDGLVAYVPAPGDGSNQFESLSCAAAAARAIHCELTGAASSGGSPVR